MRGQDSFEDALREGELPRGAEDLPSGTGPLETESRRLLGRVPQSDRFRLRHNVEPVPYTVLRGNRFRPYAPILRTASTDTPNAKMRRSAQ